jgi:hypothetical protein
MSLGLRKRVRLPLAHLSGAEIRQLLEAAPEPS